MPWTLINLKLLSLGITVSGGSITKRSLLTPLQYRLSTYLRIILSIDEIETIQDFDGYGTKVEELDKFQTYYRVHLSKGISRNIRKFINKSDTLLSTVLEDQKFTVMSDIGLILGYFGLYDKNDKTLNAIPKHFDIEFAEDSLVFAIKEEYQELFKSKLRDIVDDIKVKIKKLEKVNKPSSKKQTRGIHTSAISRDNRFTLSSEFKYDTDKSFLSFIETCKNNPDKVQGQKDIELNWIKNKSDFYQNPDNATSELIHDKSLIFNRVKETLSLLQGEKNLLTKKYSTLIPILDFNRCAIITIAIVNDSIINNLG